MLLATPTSFACAEARETISGLRSTAVMWPEGIYFTIEAVIVPDPAPTSRSLRLGFLAARASRGGRRCGALFGCFAAKSSLYLLRSASAVGEVKVSFRTVVVSVGREGDLFTV